MNHCECKNEATVTVSMERYDQLIRAEQDACHLKAFILHKFESYLPMERNELKMLVELFIGMEEEEEEDV